MKLNKLTTLSLIILLQFISLNVRAEEISLVEEVEDEVITMDYTTDEEAFFQAAKDGNTEALDLYLKSNISINKKDEYGRTAIYLAALNGRTNSVKYLLLNGADINTRTYDLKSPLFAAIEGKSFSIAKLLINAGASITITDETGKTPLHYAILNNQLYTAQFILSLYCEVDAVDDLGNTPLFYAAETNINLVQALINAGADQNFINSEGKTALHEAVIKRNTACVNYLVENGANLNIKDDFGKTPIYYANKNSFVYRKLFEAGAAKPVEDN